MPRSGWVKPQTDQRLSDHISIGVLTRVFTPELIDRVVADTGRREVRRRLLPARVVVYYVLGLALFADASYEEVMRHLVDGLSWASGWARAWQVPTKASLFKARARLGPEPLQALFQEVARPMATEQTAAAFYSSLRLMAIDGTTLDLADTAENEARFGRPGSGRGELRSASPQVRVVGLAECGTHGIVAASPGPLSSGEATLARALLPALGPGMLLLADRYYYSYRFWNEARATGAELLWRTKSNHVLPVEQRLADGSYLSVLHEVIGTRLQRSEVVVRVIEYSLEDSGQGADATRYRLITTLLDPKAAPALDLAALYPRRWRFETTLSELKTHQRGPRVMLRSKHPEGVTQELYGYLCVHYAIRWLMHTVALDADEDPDRLSFTRSLRVARRTTGPRPGFSPSGA
jgi:hypothetical protein